MLRAGVRAELREKGIRALGMESAEDVDEAIANGEEPQAMIIDGHAKAASNPKVQQLTGRVPTIVIAPRTTAIPLGSAARMLFRPVQIHEIVAVMMELLRDRST